MQTYVSALNKDAHIGASLHHFVFYSAFRILHSAFEMSSVYQKKENGLLLFIVVRPRSSQNKVIGIFNNQLKIALKSPPIDGKANQACRLLLSEIFDVPQSDVEYLHGEKQSSKRVLIYGDPNKLETILLTILEEVSDV